MSEYNYKHLPYKQSVKCFLKDYKIPYLRYGQFKKWKTKNGIDIMIRDLDKKHIDNIIGRFRLYLYT